MRTRDQIRIIIEQATVPVVVDAGLGAPSHAAEAMELGADAVLVNTAIAIASDPAAMARAFAPGGRGGPGCLGDRAARGRGAGGGDESADRIPRRVAAAGRDAAFPR